MWVSLTLPVNSLHVANVCPNPFVQEFELVGLGTDERQRASSSCFFAKKGGTREVGCLPCIKGKHGACGTQHSDCHTCEVIKWWSDPHIKADLDARFGQDQRGKWLYCILSINGAKRPSHARVAAYLATIPGAEHADLRAEIKTCMEKKRMPASMRALLYPGEQAAVLQAPAGEEAPGQEGHEAEATAAVAAAQ